ncbi:GntR family transcriptional regulator [Paenibacillus nasutitermitis]|uniref:HTH gntR-type domain-containing protein n=1 Tax=Paenibacillus nasutitermitis TaxID=1652958 RepID=A0A916ZDT3_9BACL|nr:GntR family transcriptional regulator [Paenibacillus nasutitermitis]GGD90526.1 hypothetical protein GCM10010911_56480 [Paenibacillus nasutitermitis]
MTLNVKKPLYRKIADDFKRKISRGELLPNDPIPSQMELAQIYSTSEMTIRKALAVLVDEDFVIRIRKKGSFIKAFSGPQTSKALMNIPSPVKKVYFVHSHVRTGILYQQLYMSMLTGIEQVCAKYNLDFSILDIGDSPLLPNDTEAGYILFALLNTRQSKMTDTMEQWKREKKYLVTIQFYVPDLEIPNVAGDNMAGGYMAAKHLLDLGHKRIGIILTGKSIVELNMEFSLRLQGYRMALDNYSISYDPDLVWVKEALEETWESGYEGFMALMKQPQPPTALFVTSDYKALGALKAAGDLGLRVPQDISIMGYDGHPAGQWSIPRLTSVDQNMLLFGIQAAEILIKHPGGSHPGSIIAPRLILRESTAPLAQE